MAYFFGHHAIVQATMFAHFQHGGHKPKGKFYLTFVAVGHYWSWSYVCRRWRIVPGNSRRWNASDLERLEVDIMMPSFVSEAKSIQYKPVLDFERRQCSDEWLSSSPLLVIACYIGHYTQDGTLTCSDGVKDTSLKAKTKDFKIVLEDPWGRGLVLEDSNTANVIVLQSAINGVTFEVLYTVHWWWPRCS